MRLPWKKDSPTIDDEIGRILNQMATIPVDSNDYRKLMVRLDRMYKMEAHKRRDPVSRDTLVQTAGGMLSVLVIVLAERTGPITSKVLGEAFRARR